MGDALCMQYTHSQCDIESVLCLCAFIDTSKAAQEAAPDLGQGWLSLFLESCWQKWQLTPEQSTFLIPTIPQIFQY